MATKVIIAGGRDFDNYELLQKKCDYYLSNLATRTGKKRVIIISGTADGADKLGEKYAESRGFDVERFPANWQKFGKAAGPKRNMLMASFSHYLIVFWDGKSRGTKNMIKCAKHFNLPTKIIFYENQ